jgi:hypothetical protein
MVPCITWGCPPPPRCEMALLMGGSVVDPYHLGPDPDPDPVLFVSGILLFEGAFTLVFKD